VLVRSHGWLELNQGKETTLAEQFGEEMYQHFAQWLGRFETGLLSKGWSPSHGTVMYRKMVLLGANGSWYKVRLMVHLPKTSLVSIDVSPRPVVLSMERVKPIRGPRSPLVEHSDLESITEGSEEEEDPLAAMSAFVGRCRACDDSYSSRSSTCGSEASHANYPSGSKGSTNSTLTPGSEDEAPGTGGAAGAAASGLDLGASAAAGLGLGAAGVRRLIVSL